jgi:hypothetical protein
MRPGMGADVEVLHHRRGQLPNRPLDGGHVRPQGEDGPVVVRIGAQIEERAGAPVREVVEQGAVLALADVDDAFERR